MAKVKTLKEILQSRLHKALKDHDYEVTYNGNFLQAVKCTSVTLQDFADAGLEARLLGDTFEVYGVCPTKAQLAAQAKRKDAARVKKAAKEEVKAAAVRAKRAEGYGFNDFADLIPESWGSTSHDEARAAERRAKDGFTLEETYAALNEESAAS